VSRKRKPPDLFIVTWEDIISRADWLDEAEVDSAVPETCLTVGWIIRDSPKQIIIADSVTVSGDWGGITVIPKSVIKKKKKVDGGHLKSFLTPSQTAHPKRSKAKPANRPKSKG